MTHANRPLIHLNCAIDRDGRFGAENGGSLPISCAGDWRRVHELREHYRAVAVGARTWIAERPHLGPRRSRLGREPSRQPDRVVFAGGHRCPIPSDSRRIYVVGTHPAKGRNLVFVPSRGRSLAEPLQALLHLGVSSVLVEGGPTLLRSFLAQGCYDLVTVFVPTPRSKPALREARRALPGLPPLDGEPFASGMLLAWNRSGQGTAEQAFGA